MGRDIKVTRGWEAGSEWVEIGSHLFFFREGRAPTCEMHRFQDCYSKLSFGERHAIQHAGEDK